MVQVLLLTLVCNVIGFGLHAAAYFGRRRQSDKVGPPNVSGRVVMYGIFVLVGIGFGLFGWNIAVSADDEAADWPQTDGVITEFQEMDAAVIYDRGFSFSGDVTDPLYPVLLSYEYTVDGETFSGEKILVDEQLHEGLHEFEEAELKDYRQKYAVGTTVDVLYNPDDPSEAALETADNRVVLALGVGAGVLFGLVTGVFAWPIGQYMATGADRDANDHLLDED